MPGSQVGLEREFKQRLLREHAVVFNNLLAITNLPISRFIGRSIRALRMLNAVGYGVTRRGPFCRAVR